MPLSEHEQKLLEEMERNLYHNDADFVATVSNRRGKPNYTLIVVGILLALVGIAIVVTGVIFRQSLVGAGGLIVLLGGVLLAIAPERGSSVPQEPSAAERAGASSRAAAGPGFMDRMNERWDKRQGDRDNRD